MALTQKEINERHYRNRKNNGLCPRCGKQLDRDGHYCSECLEKIKKYKKENRDFFRKNNICTECGKEKVPNSERICPECRSRKNNNRKPLSDNQKLIYGQRFRDRQKSLYQQRSELGICTRCGKRKSLEGRKKCGICLEKDAMQHRKSGLKKINVREFRKENHLCYFCGSKIDLESGNVCRRCLDNLKENGKKNGGKNEFWEQDNRLIFMRKRT